MNLSDENLEKLRTRLRFKVAYHMGFYSPDIDDVVQESLARFIVAVQEEKIRNPEADGAYLNGICRNVISEFRRRTSHDEPMPEVVPEPPGKSIHAAELFDLRDAIAHGLDQLSERDRRVLRGFYLDEKSKEDLMKESGLSDENFRVVMSRAKERFRKIYQKQTQQSARSRHSGA